VKKILKAEAFKLTTIDVVSHEGKFFCTSIVHSVKRKPENKYFFFATFLVQMLIAQGFFRLVVTMLQL